MREGWREVAVEDVAQVVGGGTPKSNVPEFWGGDVQWLTPKDLADRPARYTSAGARTITEAGLRGSAAKLLPAGTVLLTSRAPVGYVSVAAGPIATNQGFKSLILREGQLPEFWYYLLLHSTDYLRANSGGSTFQEISGGALKKLRFLVPPLDEQRRIVDLVGALDDTIAAVEHQHAALSKSLDVTRSALLVPLDGWAATTLGQVATRQIGRTPPRKEPRYWTADPSQRPFCTIAAMSDPAVSSCSEGVTELAERDGVAKRVPAGSLLMSFKLSIGRLAVPAQDVFPNEAIAWIRPKEGVLQEFLRHALAAVKWDELGSRAVMGKTLNAASLDAVPLAVPPQAEQARIVETLGAIERGAEASKLQVDRLHSLRSNLLTALLSGEHRIPESYDEVMEGVAA